MISIFYCLSSPAGIKAPQRQYFVCSVSGVSQAPRKIFWYVVDTQLICVGEMSVDFMLIM